MQAKLDAGWAFKLALACVLMSTSLPAAEETNSVRENAPSRTLYARTILLARALWEQGELDRARAMLLETPPQLRSWEFDYLNRQMDRPVKRYQNVAPVGVRVGFRHITFSPDGKHLATCTDSLRMIVWELATDKKIIDQHEETRTIAYDPTGKILVTGLSGRVRLRNSKTGKLERGLSGMGGVAGIPLRVQFSHDGLTIAAQSSQRGVQILDVDEGETRFALKKDFTEQFCFHPKKAELAVVMNRFDKVEKRPAYWIELFDIWLGKSDKSRILNLDGINWAWGLAYSLDGKRLAACGETQPDRKGLCIVFDAETGRVLHKLHGHARRAQCVAFSLDGTQIATGSLDGNVILWDAETGEKLDVLIGHKGGVNSLAFHPLKELLATACSKGEIRFWDITQTSGKVRRQTPPYLSEWAGQRVQFTAQGKLLAYGQRTYDQNTKEYIYKLRRWEMPSKKALYEVTLPPGRVILSIAQPKDQKTFLLGTTTQSRDPMAPKKSRVVVFDAESLKEVASLPVELPPKEICLTNDEKNIAAMCVEIDREASNTHLELQSWRIVDGKELFKKTHTIEGQVRTGSVCSDPAGNALATGTSISSLNNAWSGKVLLFNAKNGEKIAALDEPNGYVSDCSFSPDGTRIATVIQRYYSQEQRAWLSIWDAREHRKIAEIPTGMETIRCVRWTPDGQRIATAGGSDQKGGEISFWDAKSLDRVWDFQGYAGPINEIAFDTDTGGLIAVEHYGRVHAYETRQ